MGRRTRLTNPSPSGTRTSSSRPMGERGTPLAAASQSAPRQAASPPLRARPISGAVAATSTRVVAPPPPARQTVAAPATRRTPRSALHSRSFPRPRPPWAASQATLRTASRRSRRGPTERRRTGDRWHGEVSSAADGGGCRAQGPWPGGRVPSAPGRGSESGVRVQVVDPPRGSESKCGVGVALLSWGSKRQRFELGVRSYIWSPPRGSESGVPGPLVLGGGCSAGSDSTSGSASCLPVLVPS